MTPGSLTQLVQSDSTRARERQLAKLRTQLLLQKKWSYLRYVHFRQGLLCADGIKTVLVVGAGRALAELALAIEFPKIDFHVTDVESERTPNFKAAEKCARSWSLPNVTFGVLDVTRSIDAKFDLVASIEVLEHIENDTAAINNMAAAAREYLFCLVPFADEKSLTDPALRARAWRRNEHFRYGYSPERLRRLLPDIATMRGCYWRDRGFLLREALGGLSNGAIRSRAADFSKQAEDDITGDLPDSIDEAQGIWVLARTTSKESMRPDSPAAKPVPASNPRLDEVKKRLVFLRSWSLFRYLHLRQGLREAGPVERVLSMSAGRGFAELALALEHPDIEIVATLLRDDGIGQAVELSKHWAVPNIQFCRASPGAPIEEEFDLVCGMDMLEFAEDDRQAAAHLISASCRSVFCLVPFADSIAQANDSKRARAWARNRHRRLGYAEQDLRSLFPGSSIVRGCYWRDGGSSIQATIADLDPEKLATQTSQILENANCDIRNAIPKRYPEALGIWILATPKPA